MAALHCLSPLQTPSPKPYLPFLNPNPGSFFLSRPLKKPCVSLRRVGPPPLTRFPARCSIGTHGDYEHDQPTYPRPQEIPWSKELANSVHLIGIIGSPIQVKHLPSGKVVAWTRLGVKKSASETTWINLTFWDDLANVASQHVEKGNQVYVSGRLVSDVVEGEDEKRVFYKVVVQQLNLIERNFPAVSLYEPEAGSVASGKLGGYMGNSGSSVEELWQAFFANPVDWWDNRNNKRNPKSPDFKHKHTGEALWIEGKNNPHWVKSQLALLDSRMGSFQTNATGHSVSFTHGNDFTPF